MLSPETYAQSDVRVICWVEDRPTYSELCIYILNNTRPFLINYLPSVILQ